MKKVFKQNIQSPLLRACDDIQLSLQKKISIDPNFARANKEWSYELAKQAKLCDVQ